MAAGVGAAFGFAAAFALGAAFAVFVVFAAFFVTVVVAFLATAFFGARFAARADFVVVAFFAFAFAFGFRVVGMRSAITRTARRHAFTASRARSPRPNR